MSEKDDAEKHLKTIDSRLSKQMDQLLRPGEKLELSVPADLSLQGDYAAAALCMTNQRLVAFDSHHDHGYFAIELAAVESLTIEVMYGNYLLRLSHAGGLVTLNRFTNSVRDYFDEACRYFEITYGKSTDINQDSDPERQGKTNYRCPTCGRTLRRKNAVCPFCIDRRKVIIRLLSYVRPHLRIAAKCLFFSLIATTASLAPPYFTRILIDDVVLAGNINLLWAMVALLLLMYLIHAVFSGLGLYHVRMFSEKIIYDMRTQVFRKLQRLSLDYFDKRSTGAIMSRVSNDTQQLRGFIIQASRDTLVQLLTLLIIGIVMFSMHWQLALVTLLPIPLVSVGARYFSRKIHPVYHRVWRRRSLMNAILGDSIPGIRVIKAFTGEDRQAERFDASSGALMQEQIRAARMASFFTPSVTFMMMLGGVIIWGLGGYWVITRPDQLSLGVLVAFIGYAWRFFSPVQFLAGLSDMMQQATTSAERIFEILDVKSEPDRGHDRVIKPIRGQLEFRHVTFYYEQDKPVLENINLTIRPGETIGLVGATGSGKSTFANLLLRFYEPVEGEILLDGVNINELDLRFLRENTGFVLQEPLLFRDTIANNISYSQPDAPIESIIEAAKAANAHDFICSFPDAYDTRVGERGVGLSGGERQRVSIARAIIKDPAMLILDEATASVDTEMEQLIQEAINRLIENRTTIIIAHRLSTLKNADRIVVLDQGRIAEAGTHDELMEQQGLFYKLIKLQVDIGSDMIRFS